MRPRVVVSIKIARIGQNDSGWKQAVTTPLTAYVRWYGKSMNAHARDGTTRLRDS
jgi:hypothetical protein